MAIARVQLVRNIAGAPPGTGNHQIYSGAWFATADPVPNLAQRTALVKLLTGYPPTGRTALISDAMMQIGTAAAELRVWQGSTTVTAVGQYLVDLSGPRPSTVQTFPSQVAICLGYRNVGMAATVYQRGRSRIRIGPVAIGGGGTIPTVTGGVNPRLAPEWVNEFALQAQIKIQQLAALGWVLQVRGQGGAVIAPANEVYVDDVFDVQRSRRTWKTHEARLIV